MKSINSKEIKKTEIQHCNILFPVPHTHKDENGCILENGHHGRHVFINENGCAITWEFDFGCNCGCNETDDINDTCIVYF